MMNITVCVKFYLMFYVIYRSKNFEKGGEYSKTWKSNDDGKINTNGPRVVVDQGNGVGPSGGFITK